MLTDTHCHLDFECFDQTRDQLLNKCYDRGITKFINPSVKFANWQKVIDLHQKYPKIISALGLHPSYVNEHTKMHLTQLKIQVIAHHVSLIGEIGLDKRFLASFDQQIVFFHQQLLIAQELQKPVIIHSVKAHNEVIKALKQYRFDYGGIIHAFSGNYNIAKTYGDFGFKLGIGSILHYPQSQLPKVLSRIGIEHLLLETDSPDMLLPDSDSTINTPLSILKTRDSLAKIFHLSTDEITQVLAQNLQRICDLNLPKCY